MKKRQLAFCLGLVLVGCSITGCGNRTEAKAANASDDTKTSKLTKEYEPIELSMAVNGTDIKIDALVAKKSTKGIDILKRNIKHF